MAKRELEELLDLAERLKKAMVNAQVELGGMPPAVQRMHQNLDVMILGLKANPRLRKRPKPPPHQGGIQ